MIEQFEAWWMEQSRIAWEKSSHSRLPMPEAWVNAGKKIGERAWQASREALEVELPDPISMGECNGSTLYVLSIPKTIKALERQGIKVKA